MRHGSLFSGIGGFDLAAEWMGWENVFHCEWNEFGQKVLKYYWPKAINYGDITKTDFTKHCGTIDILTGGFPCQPYSLAGKRKGKEDDRHLWPEMLRAIQEIQPTFIVGENVPGLVNWSGGMVFEEVQADLETEEYEVIPFILPACGVNAPHRRERIWFVAKSTSKRLQGCGRFCSASREEQISTFNKRGITPYSTSGRQSSKEYWQKKSGFITKTSISNNWDNFPTQSPLCSRDDGLSSRLAGITFSKHRNESIKGYGNAIVPQVAYQIFKAIEEYEINFLK